jgi:hypothetical protein
MGFLLEFVLLSEMYLVAEGWVFTLVIGLVYDARDRSYR